MKLSPDDRLHLFAARSFPRAKVLSIPHLARRMDSYWVAESAQASFAKAIARLENRDPAGAIDTLGEVRQKIDVELFLAECVIARRAGRSDEAVAALRNAGLALQELHRIAVEAQSAGRPGVTISFLMRAGAMIGFVPSERSRGLPAIFCDLATAFADLGRIAVAEALFDLAIPHCPVDDDGRYQLSRVYSNLGYLKFNTGCFDEASALFGKSLALVRTLPNCPAGDLIGSLVNAGWSEHHSGRSANARQLLSRALTVRGGRKAPAAVNFARALLLLGEIEEDAGNVARARRLWSRVANTGVDGAGVAIRARALLRLAATDMNAKRIPRAARLIMDANRLLESDPNHDLELDIDTRLQFADVLRIDKQYDDALNLAREGLALGEERVRRDWIHNVESLRVLARIAWDREQYEQCFTLRERTLAIIKATLPRDHPKRLIADAELAEAHAMCGRRSQALRLLRGSINAETRLLQRLINSTSSPWELGRLRTAFGQLQVFISLILEGRRAARDLRVLRDVLLRQRGLAAALRKRGGGQVDLARFTEDESVLLALSETYLHEGTTKRILVRSVGNRVSIHVLGHAAELERALDDYLGSGAFDSRVVSRLTEPLTNKTGKAHTLVWLPDARLARFPIGCLRGYDGRPIFEHFACVQARDAFVLAQRPTPSTNRALVVGISEFPGKTGLPALQGVDEELVRVRDRVRGLEVCVLHNGEATRDRVLQELARSPSIFHIATHGVAPIARKNAKPRGAMGTALQLYGGSEAARLTADEIASIDLAGVKVALVAACDSGLAEADASEGVLGLQASFHAAGVQTVVTTLWPLSDLSTTFLLDALYEGLLAGMTVEDALARAQARTKSRWKNLRHWGSWVVSGTPGVTLFPKPVV